MDLTAAAIAKNRITLTVVALVMLAGISAYHQLPKAQDPGFIIRTVVITTRFPGASPAAGDRQDRKEDPGNARDRFDNE